MGESAVMMFPSFFAPFRHLCVFSKRLGLYPLLRCRLLKVHIMLVDIQNISRPTFTERVYCRTGGAHNIHARHIVPSKQSPNLTGATLECGTGLFR